MNRERSRVEGRRIPITRSCALPRPPHLDAPAAGYQQSEYTGNATGKYGLSAILCGFTSEGDGALPLAMQIAGRPFDEATVLRVAHAYEQAVSWNKRVPPAALDG